MSNDILSFHRLFFISDPVDREGGEVCVCSSSSSSSSSFDLVARQNSKTGVQILSPTTPIGRRRTQNEKTR